MYIYSFFVVIGFFTRKIKIRLWPEDGVSLQRVLWHWAATFFFSIWVFFFTLNRHVDSDLVVLQYQDTKAPGVIESNHS